MKKLIYMPSFRGYVAIDKIVSIDISTRTVRLVNDYYFDNVPREQLDFIIKVMGAYYEN